MQRAQWTLPQNAHCRKKKHQIQIFPTQIAPDVWILTTTLTAPVNTMTLIYPEKAMETITIQKPVHILKLPTACN